MLPVRRLLLRGIAPIGMALLTAGCGPQSTDARQHFKLDELGSGPEARTIEG